MSKNGNPRTKHLLELNNTAKSIRNLKLIHIISDRGSMCTCDMYAWLCAFCLFVYLCIGIVCAKIVLAFSMDLSSSIQLEDVGFTKSRGDCQHK